MIIGILGVGHLGAYLVRGLISAGVPAEHLVLSPRGARQVAALSEKYGVTVAASNADLLARADAVILAVRPQDAAEVVAQLPWRERHVLISACAGVRLATLRQLAGRAELVRAMPISAVAIARSPTAIFPEHPAAHEIFSKVGEVLVLPDEEAFSIASVSAALYGWVHDLIRSSVDWSSSHGLPEELARRLQAQTFAAAAGMVLDQPDVPIRDLVGKLATPGGITQAGLDSLISSEFERAWRAAQDVALARLRGLDARRTEPSE